VDPVTPSRDAGGDVAAGTEADALDAVAATLRTPRAAAVSGLIFSALLIAVLVLVTVSTPGRVAAPGSWLSSAHDRGLLTIAFGLVPFAGIAFLWFIGVVRDRLGAREDRLFATVFLGSGLLFVAILFVATAIGATLVANAGSRAAGATAVGSLALGRELATILIHTYALRMAGVFTMSTATILHRTKVAPRWIAVLGFVAAAALLFAVGLSPWLELLFPAWIALLSLEILRLTFREPASPRTTA
jgi:hypothetical protein